MHTHTHAAREPGPEVASENPLSGGKLTTPPHPRKKEQGSRPHPLAHSQTPARYAILTVQVPGRALPAAAVLKKAGAPGSSRAPICRTSKTLLRGSTDSSPPRTCLQTARE